MVQMGIKASWFKWQLACYKPYGSNGNQSLIAQMGIGTVLASLLSLLLCVAGHSGAIFQSAEFHYTELHPQTAAAD